MKPRYTNLSSIEPHPDYPLKMYYADEVEAHVAQLESLIATLSKSNERLREKLDERKARGL